MYIKLFRTFKLVGIGIFFICEGDNYSKCDPDTFELP